MVPERLLLPGVPVTTDFVSDARTWTTPPGLSQNVPLVTSMRISTRCGSSTPPGSGRIQSFPEIDRVEWFGMDEARRRLKAAQVPFLDRLEERLKGA